MCVAQAMIETIPKKITSTNIDMLLNRKKKNKKTKKCLEKKKSVINMQRKDQ